MAYSQAHTPMEIRTLIRSRPAVVAALLSTVLIFVGNRRGIGISWDSTDYIAVGQSMARGRGVLDVTGLPMVIRPPGLSTVVMLGDWVGLSPNISLTLLNALSMAVVVWCTHRLLTLAEVRTSAKWLGVVLIAISPALLDIFTMAWSEPPFIALTLMALVIAVQKRSWPWEFVLTALFTAMFFVRYVGPFYAAPIALVAALVQARSSGVVLAFLRAGAALAVSMVAPWLWLMRNRDLTGYLTGYRVPGGGTYLDPFKTFTGTLGSWLIGRPPLNGNGGIYLNWNDFSAIMQVSGVVVWLVTVTSVVTYFFSRTARHLPATTVVGACAWLFVFYGAFSIYRFVNDEMGPLDSRMMSGLYVPLVIMLVISSDRLVSSLGAMARSVPRALTIVAVSVIMWHGVSAMQDSIQFGREGRHWASVTHQVAPIHLFVRGLTEDAALLSNEPQSLFAATRRWPIRNQYLTDQPEPENCRHRYFVWYNNSFLPDGKPDRAAVLFQDASGQVLDLGPCGADLVTYWS